MATREKTGKVVSHKMNKTIVVAVDEKRAHPKYGKIHNVTVKFKAHDEENSCQEGDVVRIVECRPLSKEKNWRLAEVIQRTNEV